MAQAFSPQTNLSKLFESTDFSAIYGERIESELGVPACRITSDFGMTVISLGKEHLVLHQKAKIKEIESEFEYRVTELIEIGEIVYPKRGLMRTTSKTDSESNYEFELLEVSDQIPSVSEWFPVVPRGTYDRNQITESFTETPYTTEEQDLVTEHMLKVLSSLTDH